MSDEFDVLESSSSTAPAFDIKKFLFKALSYWKLFVILLILSVFLVYQKNIREEFSFRLGTKISVEDDSNPLFTSNASLTFNWGGVTSKVQTMIVTLKSRSHHEKVVERLEFYKSYLQEGRFRKKDIYKTAPFRFEHEFDYGQLLNIPVKITFIDTTTYEIEVDFPSNAVSVQNYFTKGVSSVNVESGIYKKQFAFGETVDLPFLKGVLNKVENRIIQPKTFFFLQFKSFDGVVASYRARTAVGNTKNSPIIDIALIDKNRQKIVDYLNTVVEVLSEDQLNRKNLYATNAITFIDKQLARVKGELSENANELNDYRRKKKIYGISSETEILNEKFTTLEQEKTGINRKLSYYDNLKNYLLASNSFTEIPAPSIAGIDDGNILGNISKINTLSVEKSKLQYSVRDNATIFDDLNREIEGLKKVLLENIKSVTNILDKELNEVNSKLYTVESKFVRLPEEQQELLAMQRQVTLSQQAFNVFLAKRGEAEIIKASNVSDIVVVDSAKNTGAQVLGRNLNVRYVFAFFTALILPLLLAFVVTIIDNKVHTPQDVERLSKIPLLGVVGKNILDHNLVVHRQPKSSVAEAFRAIRSSLQYIYKKHNVAGAKTVLLTSSVSGEGKTFCSINIATVLAMSGKKTILIGLDLRKPKIYGDFDLINDVGIVNYLIGQNEWPEVIKRTEISNLDVITSGPIPPNPSELLLNDRMSQLIGELKKQYDFIVLDTPPIGLVADAAGIIEYADATLYVVRQDYTKKEMINLINAKYQNREIKNLSFIYNGYNLKGKYGYGYGYGKYANGYYMDDVENKSLKGKLKRFFKIS